MMKKTFLFDPTGNKDEDFCNNITELFLELENTFESPEELAETAQEMYEYSLQLATKTQKKRFFEIAIFFKNMCNLLRSNEEIYFDLKYMLRSFADGRFLVDEENYQVIYFDHPMHQHYFNQANIKKEWYTTETK